MQIDTKKVKNRRKVRFESYDEMLADAEHLSHGEVQMLGNWSLGQIYKHLADSLDSSIDGVGFTIPLPVRWMLTLLMKKKFLKKELPAGYKSTKVFTPESTSTPEGLELLKKAVIRQNQVSTREPHPAFGKISREEWNDFHLRHAELHMSFALVSEKAMVSIDKIRSTSS